MKKIAVLMGGLSAEREVSVVTGNAIIASLKRQGYNPIPIDPTRDLAKTLYDIRPDVVFNGLHGTYGEDGAIQGILELMGIPYTHSGITASAIAMDKSKTKSLLKQYGVKSAKEVIFTYEELHELYNKGQEPMERPFVIKPLSEGSSVGVVIVRGENDVWFHHNKWKANSKLLVEEYIADQELSVAIFNNKALGVLELRPKQGFYDYKAKYTEGMTDHIYPAEVEKRVYDLAMQWAEKAHNILGCKTVSRSDFRYNSREEEGLYFLEINTHPGFTPLSIVPEIASYHGISFDELVKKILEDASCEL